MFPFATESKVPPMMGFLNLAKPPEWTSRDVVNYVAKIVRPTKAGHAGTLDPLATGVLVLALGRATKLISEVQAQPKVYRAGIGLGYTSDTDDITGQVNEWENITLPDEATVREALREFEGTIEQVPPAYSAVKVKGKRAYNLARQGEAVELKARSVQVMQIELVKQTEGDLVVDIRCGSGTYIRSIARDLGKRLGCGGLMTSLVRTAIGPFSLANALPVESLTRETLADAIRSPLEVLSDRPTHLCSEADCVDLRNGRAVRTSAAIDDAAQVVMTTPEGEFAAIGVYDEASQQIRPKTVFLEVASGS